MADYPVYNVLFLCTGNSARSILAEAILAENGRGRFNAYSAGSHPKGAPHPQALRTLTGQGFDTSALRSKSWDEFAAPDSPELHFVITVCDNTIGEVCPIWPGHPMTAHWGLPDPASFVGNNAEVAAAFLETYHALDRRIGAFVNLPIESLEKMALVARITGIHEGNA